MNELIELIYELTSSNFTMNFDIFHRKGHFNSNFCIFFSIFRSFTVHWELAVAVISHTVKLAIFKQLACNKIMKHINFIEYHNKV